MGSSWMNEDVAEAQYLNALRELEDPANVMPMRYFAKAMGFIAKCAAGTPINTFLEVGCGVGIYGLVLFQVDPKILYFGTDPSKHMVRYAKQLNPFGSFQVGGLVDSILEYSDVVMASAVLEYAGRWDALHYLLSQSHRWVILHRLRLTDGPSIAFDESTYCGNTEEFYRWNRAELIREIGPRLGFEIRWEDEMQSTIVVTPS